MLAFSVLTFAAASSAATGVGSVDPSLSHAATQGTARLLAFSRCSPEHCWSEATLEVVAAPADERQLACSTPLREVAVGHTVQSIRAIPPLGFELVLAPSHGGFEPYTALVVPLGSCQYEFRRVVAGS